VPPKNELETKTVLKQVLSATKVLAELKGRAKEIPNKRPRIALRSKT
jgi:hypothetical protein